LVGVDAGDEVVAGDFLQGQEAVALAAVIDEGGLEGGLQPDDAALVDVGLLLFLGGLLDVDVVQVLAIDDRHAQFFGLRGIDQHALHCLGFLTRSNREERRGPRPMQPNRGAWRTRSWEELPALLYLGRTRGSATFSVSGGPGPAWRSRCSRPSGAAAISVRLRHQLTWSPPWGVVAVPRDSQGWVSARSPSEIRTLSREAIV